VAVVRQARPDDVEGCVAVLAALPDFFTPDTLDEVRGGWPDGSAWVALVDGGIVGFVLASRRYPRAAEITNAAVLAEHQGGGLGRQLVDAALPPS
jgi:ribosomal protein S18 acetylase RimI-like enzyme